jgi:hypothetical protein
MLEVLDSQILRRHDSAEVHERRLMCVKSNISRDESNGALSISAESYQFPPQVHNGSLEVNLFVVDGGET